MCQLSQFISSTSLNERGEIYRIIDKRGYSKSQRIENENIFTWFASSRERAIPVFCCVSKCRDECKQIYTDVSLTNMNTYLDSIHSQEASKFSFIKIIYLFPLPSFSESHTWGETGLYTNTLQFHWILFITRYNFTLISLNYSQDWYNFLIFCLSNIIIFHTNAYFLKFLFHRCLNWFWRYFFRTKWNAVISNYW